MAVKILSWTVFLQRRSYCSRLSVHEKPAIAALPSPGLPPVATNENSQWLEKWLVDSLYEQRRLSRHPKIVLMTRFRKHTSARTLYCRFFERYDENGRMYSRYMRARDDIVAT